MQNAVKRKQVRTQAERSARTKTLLLDATIELLVEVGYSAMSTTDVAKRAGLSRGAQVHHFPRKSDLVSAAIEHLAVKMRNQLLRKMAKLPEDETRTEVALKHLWDVYRGPLFSAALEFSLAGRTDAELQPSLKKFDETLVDDTLREFYRHLIGQDPDQHPATLEVLEVSTLIVNGLAIAGKKKGNKWCNRQITLWSEMMSPLVEKARVRASSS